MVASKAKPGTRKKENNMKLPHSQVTTEKKGGLNFEPREITLRYGVTELNISFPASLYPKCPAFTSRSLLDFVYEARQSLASHSNLQTYLRSIFIYHAQREEPWTEDPMGLDHRNRRYFGHQCYEDESEGP
ncbi:hypothetical protein K1719_012343 [Acacia pycnantha]|nr:hypothetical protein K1719_012343 [Acacia pycnantha]